jgi:hypothetical protein
MTGGPPVLICFLQKSGLPLDVTVRFQINMALGDLSGTPRAAKFSNMVLPMLWTEFVSRYAYKLITTWLTECCDWVVSILASRLGSPGFQSQPAGWLIWLSSYEWFTKSLHINTGIVPYMSSQLLPSILLTICYSWITILFNAVVWATNNLVVSLLGYCAVQSCWSWLTSQRSGDGGSMHLWNVGQLLWDYVAQYPRRLSASYSQPWQPEISPTDSFVK